MVADGRLRDDPAQRAALVAFDALHVDIVEYQPKPKWLLSGLFGVPPKPPKGLYVYGGVGRGKSMLMDVFFDTVPKRKKRRVHFHAFMQELHEEMHKVRATGVDDALKPVAAKIASEVTLLCLDEMQITDITDAMIVGRLFEFLFDAGVIVVTTSNRHPKDLYKDGLNRDLFLPFIDLIQERLDLYDLDSDTDHRRMKLASARRYLTPADAESRSQFDSLWNDVAAGETAPLILKRKGREIVVPQFVSGAGRGRFADFCAVALGPGDYLAIAAALRVLFLENVPKLGREQAGEAKRFVTLIDALYEDKVQLVVLADTAPEEIYTDGPGAFEFERTVSRLHEMQTTDWGKDR